MWEIKLKEKLKDREFISLWDKEFENRATAEYDKWNFCPDSVYEENKTKEEFLFRKNEGNNIDSYSTPQGRLTKTGVEMAKYKRLVKNS